MDTLLQDLRYAARRLRKTPAFTVIVLVTLALGIGANTAIFSVVNAVLLEPLPYRDPGRLVTVEHFYPSLDALEAPVSAPGFRDYRDESGIFDGVAVQTGWGPSLTGMGDPQRLTASRVSAQFFSTLGVTPALGRTILPEEDAPGRQHVVVLSHGLWQRLFGVAIGPLGAFALTRLIQSQLYAVRATDPMTFLVVSTLLTAIALLAVFLPALRATRVDPVIALREE